MRKHMCSAFSLALALALSLMCLAGCVREDGASSEDDVLFENTTTGQLGFGDTFTYEDIEYTLGEDPVLVGVVDGGSNYEGRTFIKLPVTIKNVSDKKNQPSLVNCTFFDNKGIVCDYGASGMSPRLTLSDGSVLADEVNQIGYMRHDAQIESYMLLEYNGDGWYYVDFSNGRDADMELELGITTADGKVVSPTKGE